MTAPANFKQADITRAMKGAKNAGYSRIQLVIDPMGNMVLNASEGVGEMPPVRNNPLDRLREG